jgi:tetratricopeptide (TPR) repeat protein
MIRTIVILSSTAILIFIYLRRYLALEKGTSLSKLLFRPKNLFRHHEEEEEKEVTAAEFMPSSKDVDPKDLAKVDSFINKADILIKKGDFKDAEKYLIQALALDPGSIETHKRLGLLYLRQEQFGKAESIYRKLVVTVTDDPVFFSNLGMALYSQKKLAEAKDFYKKAIELDSDRPGRFFSLGQIYYELEEFDEALKHFKRAISMDPANLDYLLTLAHFYIDRDMKGEARRLLDDILVAFPDCEEAKNLLNF